jgi:uncharacterized protein (TIGR03086 family)
VDLTDIYSRATAEFDRRVQAVSGDQWSWSTPCTEWNVRALVNHLVNEDRWVPELLRGMTIEDVGDRFDGDLLGNDPKTAWRDAMEQARAAVSEVGALERTVHLSFGDLLGRDYIAQVATDHVVHAWDLARGIGAVDRLDPELVEFAYGVLEPQVQEWREAGAFEDEVQADPDADLQTKLLAITGRKA